MMCDPRSQAIHVTEPPHKYGGLWTQRKLAALDNYLEAYKKVLKYQRYKLIYIDAFAGAGDISAPTLHNTDSQGLLEQAQKYREGSPLIALKHEFDQYFFIELDPQKIQALRQRIDAKSSGHYIKYMNGDANQELPRILDSTDWSSHRAVVFLDPFATEVRWETIETIANTKAIDLWLLFPAMAVNRMLKKGGPDSIDPKWRGKLTALFGTDDWEKEFYSVPSQLNLLDETSKVKDSKHIFLNMSRFVTKRLQDIFVSVNQSPLILSNTLDSPLFLLCFAASNPKGAKIAVRIADHILGEEAS